MKALSTSAKLRNEADKKIKAAVEEKYGEKVAIAVIETNRTSNSFIIYNKTFIKLKVSGIEICLWTIS